MSHTEIIEQRLHFLGFDKQNLDTMKQIKSILEPSIDHMLDRFYEKMTQEPKIKALFPTANSIAAARGAQRAHWMNNLFSGDIGKAHFDNAERIGKTHERIGLSLSYYLGGYCIMLNQFLTAINDHFDDKHIDIKMVQALNKAVFLDIDSVIDSYLEAKDHAIKKVLIQTEQFSSGLKKINSKLGKQATDHQNHLFAICNKGQSVSKRTIELEKKLARIKKQKPNPSEESSLKLTALLQESAALLKTNREINLGMVKAEVQASQLTDQINNLNFLYDKLQDDHKCHFTTAQEQPVLQKIKSFFSSN
jgi:truncated hemoglobin YjbI